MLSSLRELGLLSARYAEEEALRSKRCMTFGTITPIASTVTESDNDNERNCAPKPTTTSTIVSAPIPPIAAQKVVNVASSSSSCSSSLPGSPLFVQSPPTPVPNPDNNVAANLIPLFAAQHASIPDIEKLQQMGLGLLHMTNAFMPLATPSGLLVAAPANFPAVRPVAPALPTTVLTTAPHYSPPVQYTTPAASSVEVFSSLPGSRVRKPFHKRRPAHMDKNMLFCHFCGRKETPEWRKGPSGPATLCNACGLQWAKKIRAQRSSNSSSTKPSKNASKAASSSNKSSEETSSDAEISKVEN